MVDSAARKWKFKYSIPKIDDSSELCVTGKWTRSRKITKIYRLSSLSATNAVESDQSLEDPCDQSSSVEADSI